MTCIISILLNSIKNINQSIKLELKIIVQDNKICASSCGYTESLSK